jgi:site-specific DNA-methyltransferase (adenine-specific)
METEYIMVFCCGSKTPKYNPQMIELKTPRFESFASSKSGSSPIANINKGKRFVTHRHPKNILDFKRDRGFHPTQKPVALMEYLIKTYTNEGETVLDFTMGSGTTGAACVNTNRNFIGIEQDAGYFKIAQDRIADAQKQPPLAMTA